MEARKLILSFNQRRYTTCSIANVGEFRIQSLTERERSHMESLDPCDFKAYLIQQCVVDADGQRVFSEDDLDRIKDVDSCVTNALVDCILEHLGVNALDRESLVGESKAGRA